MFTFIGELIRAGYISPATGRFINLTIVALALDTMAIATTMLNSGTYPEIATLLAPLLLSAYAGLDKYFRDLQK